MVDKVSNLWDEVTRAFNEDRKGRAAEDRPMPKRKARPKSKPQAIVAMVLLEEVTDPRLDPRHLNAMALDPSRPAVIREAILEALPKLTRVIAIMPPEHAQFMMQLADHVASEVTGEQPIRPHPDYKPPRDRRH